MAYRYQLILEDGTDADPSAFYSAEPDWQAGDEIVSAGRLLKILARHDQEAEHAEARATLVVRPI
jgi:hypothetical protein